MRARHCSPKSDTDTLRGREKLSQTKKSNQTAIKMFQQLTTSKPAATKATVTKVSSKKKA
ncbi:hypothetical protein E2P71_10010 [Candidatus Bathyarchaeota archaeon]|nr:hypothetical protein E2P71_10010 [Candidatus Bathyarchaeota archaeon]